MRTGRLEAFSDGVFAIAITLLVLEIAVPAGSDEDLVDALVEMWPTCFSTIGAVWFGHTVITEYLDHADSVLIRLNLLHAMSMVSACGCTRSISGSCGPTWATRM